MKNSLNFNDLLAIWKRIAEQQNIVWKNTFLQWDLPDTVKADFALTLALPISHKTKKTLQEVTGEIIKLTAHYNLEYNSTKQGYINFRFPTSFYQQFLNEALIKKGQNLYGGKKNIRLNIEYVSANPTGYLHLAHFRHAVIGNTLANVYQFCGYEVVKEYYINDRGGQVNALVNSVYHFYHQLQNVSLLTLKKIEYLGYSSQELAQKLVERWGSKYINKELSEEEFKFWKEEILNLILTKIRQDLERCGIKFDIWFSETNLYEKDNHLKLLKELKKRELIYIQEGATFFRSTLGEDDKDRVIIKKDSDYTYFFSDILYFLDKLQRSDKLIYIWGADHHGTIARLKSAWRLLGYDSEKLQIILVQIVNLLTKEGSTERFSKRSGNTIELEEALRYIDIDQLKFFLLEKDPNQPISINTELLKENREKTRLYYIQYAYARCHQILQKAQERGLEKISFDINLLKKESERKIFNLLIRFSLVLENIIEENKPHHLIYYLYELSRAWQVYYQNNPILEPGNRELTSQKLLLVSNIQIILKLGLGLIGITALERM
jgi:arginyl-tRNA synthetase